MTISEEQILAAPASDDQRFRFGQVAAQYDRVRPGYPEGLIDIVMAYGNLVAGDTALDVGAGTGQATIQFAARGLSVVALEPSAAMREIANQKFDSAGLDAVAVAGEFESADLGEDAFSLVCAATSWHWLEPTVRFTAAARAIVPGGTLAVIWTWPHWRRSALRPALDDVYRHSGAPLAEMGPMYPGEPDVGALAREWVRDTGQSGVFAEPQGKLASWSVRYSATGYTELLGTYGDHICLDPALRTTLWEGIEHVIHGAGGSIEVQYSTLLLLARARHPSHD